jgi:hypothetical protein
MEPGGLLTDDHIKIGQVVDRTNIVDLLIALTDNGNKSFTEQLSVSIETRKDFTWLAN